MAFRSGGDNNRSPMIFISYRRDDSAGYARALYDLLGRRFGAQRVFMDVDDIGAGEPFADVIGRAVGGSQVLLVLIGPRWRGVRPDGTARIDDADDFVRREVAAGLQRGLRVMPVLLDGATMPQPLPPDLQPLATRNAVALDAGSFSAGAERLARSIGPRAHGRRLVLAAGVVVVAGAGAAGWWWRNRRPAINGRWEAEVTYDWAGARHVERFQFEGEGHELTGRAGFLRLPRIIVDGEARGDRIRFTTVTEEVAGSVREARHHYRARLVGDELHVTLQTEGGFSQHAPVTFVARRMPAS